MILSDGDIIREMRDGNLHVSPITDSQFQPASVDLRLGEETYDCRHDRVYTFTRGPRFEPQREGYMYLCHSQETIGLPPHIGAKLHGRSSLARKGLAVHITGGWVDPGFRGELVFEVVNLSCKPIEIPIGQRVAQLTFHYLNSPADVPYDEKRDAKYMDQTGAVTSRLDQDNDS